MAVIQRYGDTYIMPGERPGSEILFVNDGYYYHKHHNDPTSLFFHLRCVKRNQQDSRCRGRATISRDGMNYKVNQPHTNHGPDFVHVEEMQLRANILRRCERGDPTPFSIIVREEGQRGGFSMAARSRLSSARLRWSMRNARSRNLPPVPRNLGVFGALLSDLAYQHMTTTLDGLGNVFAGYCGMMNNGTMSVVFASQRMLSFLEHQQKIFADGTFKKRPKRPTSSQILNISCTWENNNTRMKHTIVAVRILMLGRSEEAYSILFQFLKHVMPQWQPSIILCDHERALVNALLKQFPTARVVTCLWHYAVDVFRYAKSLGLHADMEADPLLNCVIRCCCVLPLLPNYLIPMGLQSVIEFARGNGLLRYQALATFFNYLHREWISNRLEYLSVCGCEDRTNNVSESVNSALSWELKQDRPNIFELTRAFVRQEDQYVVDMHALANGLNPGRAQRTTALANDDRIKNLTSSLLRNQIGILHFLLAASQTYQAPYYFVFN